MELCLGEPDLFLFLAAVHWDEIRMIAEETILVTIEEKVFQWVYADPLAMWCFLGDIAGGAKS